MIQETIVHTVICDSCGKDVVEGCHFSFFWTDKSLAEAEAMEVGWLKKEDKHYCQECYSFYLNDNLITTP
jgi:hypothetical protein